MAAPRPLSVRLGVRQEPQRARVLSVRTDRRPIDPPVIVQVFGSWNLSSFVSATLVKEDSDETVWFLDDGKTCSTQGALVSDVHHVKDPENGDANAVFAVFADVSVRKEGVFRLRLSLHEITENDVQPRGCVFSSPFRVYASNEFPGMEASSRLTCSLAKQSVKIRVRKEVGPRKKADALVPSEPPRKRARWTSLADFASTSDSPRSASSSTALPPISALGLPTFATSFPPLPLPSPPVPSHPWPYWPPMCGYGYAPPLPSGGYGYGLPPPPGAPWTAPLPPPLPSAAMWPPPPTGALWPSRPLTLDISLHLPPPAWTRWHPMYGDHAYSPYVYPPYASPYASFPFGYPVGRDAAAETVGGRTPTSTT